jgi:hypothetical protein
MENEKNNKQNDIISKAKESIYKFQKQFKKSNDKVYLIIFLKYL